MADMGYAIVAHIQQRPRRGVQGCRVGERCGGFLRHFRMPAEEESAGLPTPSGLVVMRVGSERQAWVRCRIRRMRNVAASKHRRRQVIVPVPWERSAS